MATDSFFEKLKKGMGIEEPVEEEVTEEPPKKKRIRAKATRKMREAVPAELKIEEKPIEPEPEVEEEVEEIEKPEIKEEEIEVEKPSFIQATESKEKWFEPEGQLALDVYQTENDLVIQSAIAGVSPESLSITIEKDILTIKGSREKPFEEEGDYFSQECYWGSFSREVILPVEVDPDRAEAVMKEGILTIRIPKILREKKRRIKVRR